MVVAAHDFEGELRWLVRPGEFHSMHGFCSSPILYKDKVILNGDHDGDSYLVALSRTDGQNDLENSKGESHSQLLRRHSSADMDQRAQMVL